MFSHSVKRKRNDKNKTKSKSKLNMYNNAFDPNKLDLLKNNFNNVEQNKVIQNALCSNYITNIVEVRDYMQSLDRHFTHSIQPALHPTDQGRSGRCWMFAVLNVLRHELVRDLHLEHTFEFSESYLAFYEKIEKSNYILTYFIDKNNIDQFDLNDRFKLINGLSEGGQWQSCVNLIKKYGLIPKSCFSESVNSFIPDDLDTIISTKLREFSMLLVKEKQENRLALKSKMLEEIYNILAKMLGTPPNPTDVIIWNYVPRLDLTEKLDIEKQRNETGEYNVLKNKHKLSTTALDFYNNFISHKFNDYLCFVNDPRNDFNKYYESYDIDYVIEGEKTGFYNLNIDDITKLCITSILNNTPIQIGCDVHHYFSRDEKLWDNKCFNYDLIFFQNFFPLTKQQMLELSESSNNHAMILVGVDLDIFGEPIKWKVENSWGTSCYGDDSFYTMSHEWFKKYVFDVVIYKDYVPRQLCVKYNNAKKHKIILPEHDILA